VTHPRTVRGWQDAGLARTHNKIRRQLMSMLDIAMGVGLVVLVVLIVLRKKSRG
jgi:hypothetical protein